MKRIILFSAVMFLLISCDMLEGDKISSTDVGGDTNLSMNAVGTTFNSYVTIGTTTFNANSKKRQWGGDFESESIITKQ